MSTTLSRPAPSAGTETISGRDPSNPVFHAFWLLRLGFAFVLSGGGSLGADRVVVLPTGHACALTETPSGALASVVHALTLLVQQGLVLDVEGADDRVDLVVLPPLCPLAVWATDFRHSRELINRARDAAGRWLNDGGGHVEHPDRPFDLTTFPNDEGYDELVLARDIPFQSLCQHHLLPFHGVAHVGYIPDQRILGLSKLARMVELFAHDLQVQERLTQQVADWLDDHVAPRGIGVVIEAEHLCMSLRGVKAQGSRTVTSAVHGLLRDDGRSRSGFFALTGTHR